jgi:hypothetical protein
MAAIEYRPTVAENHQCAWLAGDNSVHVAGESYHQDHIELAVQHFGIHNPFCAWLIPEPENAHDKDAVAVYVGGGKVGYLPRDLAGRWHWALLELQAETGLRAACVGKFFVSAAVQDWVRNSQQVEVLLTMPHPPAKPPKQSGMVETVPSGGLTLGAIALDTKCQVCGATWRVDVETLSETETRPCSHPFAYNQADVLLVVDRLRGVATKLKALTKKG